MQFDRLALDLISEEAQPSRALVANVDQGLRYVLHHMAIETSTRSLIPSITTGLQCFFLPILHLHPTKFVTTIEQGILQQSMQE